jgi:Flp pilus assembly pilin Flp
MSKGNPSSTKLFRNEQGQAVVEYATMLTLLVAMVVIMHAVGTEAKTLFSWVVSVFQ